MDRYTDCRGITEIPLKTALNTNNQLQPNHSSLTANYCLEIVVLESSKCLQCASKKDLKESMVRCAGCRALTENMLKTALNTIQPIFKRKRNVWRPWS